MSLAGAITSLPGAITASVSRPATGAHGTDGRWSAGTPTVLSATGQWQPLNGRELERLAEGRRNSENHKFITATEMRIGDVLTVGSETWEVFEVKNWSATAGFYKALATKKGD